MSTTDYCANLVRERDMDRYLATLYAPLARRAGLFALHALDLELAEVVRTTTEPMLGQIRLAWWREQLQGLGAGGVPAQPVLAALSEHVVAHGVSGLSLEPLEDANLALIQGEPVEYTQLRGRTLFGAALRLLVPAPSDRLVAAVEVAGIEWATGEALRGGLQITPAGARKAGRLTVPSTVRPLLALGALARRDIEKMSREGEAFDRRRGTPARQMRLLWSIVTGR